MTFQITQYSHTTTAPADIEDLLNSVYVGEGFTDSKAAARMFVAQAVLSRGETLVAHPDKSKSLAGMIVVVSGESPASRVATTGEVELHLLAVRAEFRGQGAGKLLVESAIARARTAGRTKVVLWTQPAMKVAQQLYSTLGFARDQSKDFTARKKSFLVFEYSLQQDNKGEPMKN